MPKRKKPPPADPGQEDINDLGDGEQELGQGDISTQGKQTGQGDISAVADGGAEVELPAGLPIACAREGETRKQTWERLRREARGVGATRKWAVVYASREVERLCPPTPEPEPEPVITTTPAPEPGPEPEAPAGVAGLGDLPGDWPILPPNASLQAEVAWVQASRVDVVEPLPGGGARVRLARAATPAPSRASLSWLETSILYPSKWADVAVRATQGQQDEQVMVRRERKSIEELRAILAEMEPRCPHCGESLL